MLYNKDWELKDPTPKNLSYLLRHKELWPEDFQWNYNSCLTCAAGLARAFWKMPVYGTASVGKELGMTKEQSKKAFLAMNYDGTPWVPYREDGLLDYPSVEPNQVADVLDSILEEERMVMPA